MNRKLLALTVSAVALSSAAMAQTTLNGGGATLPQPTYQNEFTTYSNANPNTLFSYAGVGSGTGQTAFLTDNISLLTPVQYGTQVGSTVAFGASDAFLTPTQQSSYNRAGTDGAFIQIPMIGVAVTAAYNISAQKGTLTLTDDQLCGLLSGKFTTLAGLQTGTDSGPTLTVVYRSDSSGTTFLTTQHLNAVCSASNSNFGGAPAITKTFASLFPNGVPGNFNGQSGSGAVATTLLNTANSIGYLSPDYTSIATKSSNKTTLKVASLVNGVNGVAYAPSTTNITLGLNNAGPGSTNATPPTGAAASNQLNWVPAIPVTNKGYPIVGYTTWDLSTCYADPNVTSGMIGFLTAHFGNTAYKTLIKNNGFVSVSSTKASPYVTAIKNDFLTNKSKLNLNIGGSSCNGLPGRS